MSSDIPIIHAPRGAHKTAKGWIQEAAKRMLMNNLDLRMTPPCWCNPASQ
jgi:urocanate hydratase